MGKSMSGRWSGARWALGSLAVLPILLMSTRPAAAAIPVTLPGQVLSIPGAQYELAADLVVPAGGIGVQILANGIEFNGKGHTITGPGTLVPPKTLGIEVVGTTGVSVHNINVEEISIGIRVRSAERTSIYLVRGFACQAGIELADAHDGSITSSRFSDNHWGLYLAYATRNVLAQNSITDNTRTDPLVVSGFSGGVFLGTSDGNAITGNTILRNGSVGVWCYFDADYNTIRRNVIAEGQYYGFTTYATRNQILENRIVRNKWGVSLSPGALGNVVHRNEVFANTVLDMEDGSLPASTNLWTLNAFKSDNETGAAYGPGAGWIQ